MTAQKKMTKTKIKPEVPRPRLKTISVKVPAWVTLLYYHTEPGCEKVGGCLTVQRL